MNNVTELVFILDRSGSMAGLESDTIGGFNAMLEKQKKEPARPMYPPCCSTTSAAYCMTVWRYRRCRP